MITTCIISFIIVASIIICAILIIDHQKYEEPQNKVRFYVARDKDKTLWLYLGNPIREEENESFAPNKHGRVISHSSRFENFGLNLNDYKDLKWENKPVEVFLNLED